MTDDIVTRLRENCETTDCVNVRSIAFVKCDNCEAADEIERLRKELTTEQTLVMLGQVEINHLQEWKQVANMFGECFRMDEFGQSPVSDGQDVFQATLAWERLRTKEVGK
jgi:transketolase